MTDKEELLFSIPCRRGCGVTLGIEQGFGVISGMKRGLGVTLGIKRGFGVISGMNETGVWGYFRN